MGGCASTNAGNHPINCLHQEYNNKPIVHQEQIDQKKNEFHEQYHHLLNRISLYEQESYEYYSDLFVKPKSLLPENLRYGYISVNSFFNIFHAGFCAPYISNPNYMLLVDFRSKEEYDENHILTAKHFETLSWDMIEHPDMCGYSLIVFYDQDGTAAANVLSILNRVIVALRRKQIEGMCILGGIKAVSKKFPHFIQYPNREDFIRNHKRLIIPWMPTLIKTDRLYLGRHEQIEEKSVIYGLNITHILSIGRSPENRFEGIFYFGLDGERDLVETFTASYTIIKSVIKQNGKILVHGIEGLNRSAAMIIAYLMKSTPCTLEDAYFFVHVLRPFIRIDDMCMECLLKIEKELFGNFITDLDELWT